MSFFTACERKTRRQHDLLPDVLLGDGTGKDQKPYLETLARELNKDIYVF